MARVLEKDRESSILKNISSTSRNGRRSFSVGESLSDIFFPGYSFNIQSPDKICLD